MESYNELLIKAIAQSDINAIKYCLRKGANVNKICSGGVTPLGAAAQSGNFAILKILVENTKSDIENENCSKPLYLTLDIDNSEKRHNIGYFVVCKDLDDNDFGDGPTPDGMDALEWDMEIMEENIDEIPSSPEISIYKWYAKILNQTSIVLKSPEYDISRLDSHGRNVLHYAVRYGSKDMVDYLLSTFTEINVNQCDSSWCTPLHLACLNGNMELIHLLIRKGANINAANTYRETPLHISAQKGNIEIVSVLIENGANLNVYDMEDRSPLSLAISNSQEDVAKYLIDKGSRLNHEESYGITVLYKAVWNNLYETTKYLLQAGAKIIHSHYLLHLATRHNNLEMVKLLHDYGAVINIRDERGNTPLMFA